MSALAGARANPFVALVELTELAVDQPCRFVVGGSEICLLRTEDNVLAFEDRCPHRGHPLSEGACENGVLRCALHGWEFSIPEGRAVSPSAPFGLSFIPTRIIDNIVEVEL